MAEGLENVGPAERESFLRFIDPRLELEGLLHGHRAELLVNGTQIFPAMLAAIAAARRTVDLCSYIFRADEIGWTFARALAEAARRGVAVRVTYDSIGCIDTGKEHFKFMRDAGVMVRTWNPLIPKSVRRLWRPNSRDHRKILVTDDWTAFVGGANVGDEYDGNAQDMHHWRDNAVRLEGPVAPHLAALARQTYLRRRLRVRLTPPPAASGGEALVWVHSPHPFDPHRMIYRAYDSLIRNARRYLWIQNSYFVPEMSILQGLANAARRGVDVRLILPGYSDVPAYRLAGRRWYEFLIERGVKLFELQGTILHGKIAVADDVAAIIGSANLDNRSFHLNWEVLVTILSKEFGKSLSRQFETDLSRSRPVDLIEWRRRPIWTKFLERVAYAFAPFW